MVAGVEIRKGMTTRAIIFQVYGVPTVTKFARLDKGPHSVWEAPNALQVGHFFNDQAVNELRTLIAEGRARRTGAGPSSDDPIEQIQRLAVLRDRGIVTEEEFQAKKQQLLGL
jgi:hypothetical protein